MIFPSSGPPIFHAIGDGDLMRVESLLASGASLTAVNDMGETPLHAAVLHHNVEVVRALLAAGAPVNAQIKRPKHQYDGRTPLMSAACGNNLVFVKLLLEHGADPFLKDGAGFTALTFAEIFGKRVANHLRKVMSVSPAASELPIHDAARAGIVERVAALLDAGVDVNSRDAMKATPLHCAAQGDRVEVVKLLLARGAEVDAANVHGSPPLLLTHDPEVARLLLEAGADPNLHVSKGMTTFLYHARFASPQLLTLLLDAGADLTATGEDGTTVLDAAKGNRAEARRLLKARMGIAEGPIDRLRAEMKALPQLAKSAEFQETAAWVGELFNRKPAPWKRRRGVVYFHNVSPGKYLAPHYNQTIVERDAGQVFDLLARLQDDVRNRGFILAYVDALPSDDGRLPLILLPTADKYAALLACGTNGINKGHDTEAVMAWLMEMEEKNPFVLAGCGLDFVDGRFSGAVADAEELAQRMIAFCPDVVDQADAVLRAGSRAEQASALARELSTSRSFGLWWD